MIFGSLEDSKFDDLIGMETGASIIFGNTGGVMEAAMRTAYKLITDKEPPPYALTHLEDVRGMNGVKEATVQLGDDVTLSVAVVHGGKNTRDFLNTLKKVANTMTSSKLWHARWLYRWWWSTTY